MKNFLFLLISFLTAFHVQAQIKLNTDGSIALRPSSVFEVPLGSTLELPCGTFIR